MQISQRTRARRLYGIVSGLFSMLFLVASIAVWFMNSANAGIGVWTPPEIQQITDAGSNFVCTVADNKVYCWGNTNTYGQLGTGDNTTVSLIPRQVYDPNGVLVGKQITAIATVQTGGVCVVASNVPYCWGRGQYGALGDNTTSDRYYPSAVTTSGVLAGKTITALAAGDGHVCVVASGAAYCWGAGGNGRLGDGGTAQRNTPVAVSTSGVLSGKTVTSIGAGSGHTCVTASGAAYCWGDDTNGYLGNDASYSGSLTPVAVDTSGVLSGKTIQSITSGQNHVCVLTTDGIADCWGQNTSGQLGNTSTTTSPVPVAVTTSGALSGKTIAKLKVGDSRSCAIDTNSKAYCWGAGPVGDGSSSTKTSPVAVTSAGVLNGMNITQVAGNVAGNCFLNDLNRLYCNSSSANGTLGNNTTNSSVAPVQVLFTATFNAPNYRLYANADSSTPGSPLASINTGATLSSYGQAFRVRMGIKTTPEIGALTSGGGHTCGLSGGLAYCWGLNTYGQLGNNSTSDSWTPVAVDTSGVLSGKTIKSISAGQYHTCAIASDDLAYCWGYGAGGRLGNASTSESHVPVAVTTSGVLSGKTILSIATGGTYTCAIASDNNAYCWGTGSNGQLGNNGTSNSSSPVAVSTAGVLSGKNVLSISAGYNHVCAIASDNNAYCWGYDNQGQLGDNSTTQQQVPVAVNTAGVLSGKTIRSISAKGISTDAHTCAIASDGLAYCWGRNFYGALGNNSTSDSLVPVAVNTAGVLSGKTIRSIASGGVGTCALASDSNVYCWGYNSDGQLGDNSTTESHVPVAVNTSGVLSGKTITGLMTSTSHACAMTQDNKTFCWGLNTYGRFGNNSTDTSLVPIAAPQLDSYVPGAAINPNDNTYKLQFAEKTLSSCSVQTGYADVTASTAIAFNTNASVTNGTTITSNANDPVPTTDSVPQTYISSTGTFTNATTITGGKTGLWDFSLKDNSSSYGSSYCLRLTYGSGSSIEGVMEYPEIQTSTKKDVAVAPYRFYQNADSLTPGSPLGVTGQPATLTYGGQAFRLRAGVMGMVTASKVAAGGSHSCMIGSDDNLYCWGLGNYGQLGDNDIGYNFTPSSPDTTGVLSGKTISSVSTGFSYTCVIASDNNAYCWGLNTNGQLGNNSTSQSNVPVAVNTAGVLSGKTILAISTGTSHTCVIASDNNAYCWGLNTNGQLGNNSTTESHVPVAVDTSGVLSGKTISSIRVGTSHTCVIASDNNAYCWGLNTNGQLGNNSTTESHVAVAVYTAGVLSSKTILSLSAGNLHNCVVASDNLAYCWGAGGNGRLGNNSGSQSQVPVAVNTAGVLSGKTVTSIAAAAAHTCAIASDNQVYCWGYNANGYLGNNSTTQSQVPVAVDVSGVLAGKTIATIAAKFYDTCATSSDGEVYCWGNNGSGQLGVGDVNTYLVPQRVLNYLAGQKVGVAASTAIALSTGYYHTCAIASNNNAYCWGYNSDGQLGSSNATSSIGPTTVPVDTSGLLSGKTILSISAGYYHTCAIASDNNAYCWGSGGGGKLGNNSGADSSTPVAVDTSGVLSGKTILSISTSPDHTCAIASDNNAYCWGSGTYGQLGNNSPSDSLVPVAVDTSGLLSGKTILSISAGWNYTCAIASDNNAYCWGYNINGQLGNNSTSQSNVPVAVNTAGVLSGKTVSSISTGNLHTCAIASDNNAYCWGLGSSGRLGNNSTTESHVPVAVDTSGVLSGKTIISITNGYQYTCAIASDNQAYCWGNNSDGQLGNNSTTQSQVPVAVDTSGALAGKTVLSLDAGSNHTCALMSDNQVYCWGKNNFAQLGDGSFKTVLVPTAGYGLQYTAITGSVPASSNDYILQYAVKSAATCSAQTTGFADVTTSTPIAYNTNASATHGAAISTHANDPLGSSQTVAQAYISASGSFTNASSITDGTMGMWDFSLKDNGAPYNTSYCLRIAHSDGSALTSTPALPEVRTTLGVLGIGFVNGIGVPLSTPTSAFSSVPIKTIAQGSTATFGSSIQRLRIYNDLATNGWSVSLAATDGPTALWDRTDNLAKYDFNDGLLDLDGGDGDLLGGALSVNPSIGTISSPSGCSTSGVSKGSTGTFNEGTTDSVGLMSATSGAAMGCTYDITGIGLSQDIPASQAHGTYTLDVTATVVAL